MAYDVKILLDSVAPCGKRLTTFEVTMPRFILAEFNTHRSLSRNASSSRAIPTHKIARKVLEDPFVPSPWTQNQKGMQASKHLDPDASQWATKAWFSALNCMVRMAEELQLAGVHKQQANRLLEPFMWATDICSATEWANFFALRSHPDAQPEFQVIADWMLELYWATTPTEVKAGEWHLPYITQEDREALKGDIDRLKAVSVARCCRVSYLNQDGKRDYEDDIRLHDFLKDHHPRHMSPFEHVARASYYPDPFGNFIGWYQYRQEFSDQNITELPLPRSLR